MGPSREERLAMALHAIMRMDDPKLSSWDATPQEERDGLVAASKAIIDGLDALLEGPINMLTYALQPDR